MGNPLVAHRSFNTVTIPAPGWRTTLVAQGVDVRTQARVPVVIGLIESAAGGVVPALRVGEDGDPVILSLQAAAQHLANVRTVIDELFKVTGERIGGE
jgi:hypothetical protein